MTTDAMMPSASEDRPWFPLVAALAEAPGASVMVFDTELRYLLVRGEAVSAAGMDPRDLEGRLAPEVLPPDRWAVYEPMYRSALVGGEATLTMPSPDGDRAYRIRVAPVHDEKGAVVAGVAVATEVTEDVRRAEQAERSAALIAENTADVLLRYDSGGTLLWASPALRSVLGFDPDAVVGTAFSPAVDADRHWVRSELDLMLTGGRDEASGRFRCLTADGRQTWLDLRARLARDRDEADDTVVVSLRDVTEQVAVEERYRLLADNSADVVVGADSAGILTYVSPAVTELLGWRPEDLVGTRMRDLVHPDDVPGVAAAAQAMQPGRSGSTRARLRQKDGSYRWVGSTARLVRGDDGAPAGGVAAWRDVQSEVEAQEALALERERLRAVLDAQLEPHVFLAPIRNDAGEIVDFVCEDANAAACAAIGLPRGQVLGSRVRDLLSPQAGPDTVALFAGIVESGEPLSLEDFAFPSDAWGPGRRFDVRGVPVEEGLSFAWREVTERYDSTRALALDRDRSDALFRMAMESAPIGMAVISLNRRFVRVNPALCEMLGRDEEWLLRHRVADVMPSPEAAIDSRARAEVAAGADSAGIESVLLTSSGRRVTVTHRLAVLREDDGRPASFVSQFVDVTAERRAQAELAHLATHDALTQLPNRREFLAAVERTLSHPPRTGTRVAALFCDLDGLKETNDEFGHAAGDELLVQTGRRIRGLLRQDDLVARLGGDEFVVGLTAVRDVADAVAVADTLVTAVSQPYLVEGRELHSSISIGVVVAEPGDAPQDLLRKADLALYRAKGQGKNRAIAYDPTVDRLRTPHPPESQNGGSSGGGLDGVAG